MILAKEMGLSYAALALVTDYDSWKDDEKAVGKNFALHNDIWSIQCYDCN